MLGRVNSQEGSNLVLLVDADCTMSLDRQRQIGERIKERRVYLGYSQEQLGIKTGLSRGTIGHYETGRNPVTAVDLETIAKALRVPVSYFYGDEPITSGDQSRITVMLEDLPAEKRADLEAQIEAVHERHRRAPGTSDTDVDSN
jgi:transcriptional regulator with XRE-family HTH domain